MEIEFKKINYMKIVYQNVKNDLKKRIELKKIEKISSMEDLLKYNNEFNSSFILTDIQKENHKRLIDSLESNYNIAVIKSTEIQKRIEEEEKSGKGGKGKKKNISLAAPSLTTSSLAAPSLAAPSLAAPSLAAPSLTSIAASESSLYTLASLATPVPESSLPAPESSLSAPESSLSAPESDKLKRYKELILKYRESKFFGSTKPVLTSSEETELEYLKTSLEKILRVKGYKTFDVITDDKRKSKRKSKGKSKGKYS